MKDKMGCDVGGMGGAGDALVIFSSYLTLNADIPEQAWSSAVSGVGSGV